MRAAEISEGPPLAFASSSSCNALPPGSASLPPGALCLRSLRELRNSYASPAPLGSRANEFALIPA